MTSLNPVLTIGYQIAETVRQHQGLSRQEARSRASALLDLVGIVGTEARLDRFPHQFSGGQRQRIMIAIALSCQPSLLIADEPTTALDVTIQAQIVELVTQLQRKLGMAVIWISHDLALVAGLVDRIAVMYAGRIVEEAPVAAIYARPRHPYTLGLLQSLPGWNAETPERLTPVPGSPPDARLVHRGCPFSPRCRWVVEQCRTENPPLRPAGPDRWSACWRIDAIEAEQEGGT